MSWTPRIAEAVICRREIDDAVRHVLAEERKRHDDFIAAVNQEGKEAELIALGLNMPEGSAGRRVAEAVLSEMRAAFPDAARRADEKPLAQQIRESMVEGGSTGEGKGRS